MKVTKTTTTGSETSATLDLFSDLDLNKEQKKKVRDAVSDFIIEQTLLSVADEKSPIQGEGWKKSLSKEYRKKKLDEIGNSKSDMQFTGETLDSLSAEDHPDGIKIGVFGERAPAADGHNNLSGKSKLPQRRYIPDKGQEYKSDIQKEVERIITDVIAEDAELKAEDLRGITSKFLLYEVLSSLFGRELSRAELKLAVYRNENVLRAIMDEDLEDLL